MRVISLVPSLTETLITCGVEVVGRTRFCIHPADKVKSIRIVGGTKGVNWSLCESLAPDLVVFDKEENTREMADTCPLPWVATHVTSVAGVGTELHRLAASVGSDALKALAAGWDEVTELSCAPLRHWADLPGLLSLIGAGNCSFELSDGQGAGSGYQCDRIEYLIWKEPWMAVSRATFIGSVLQQVGLGRLLADHDLPYPELSSDDMRRPGTVFLFASEPYPFARRKQQLEALGLKGALVDGEFYSWFGVRSYRMLKSYLMQHQQ